MYYFYIYIYTPTSKLSKSPLNIHSVAEAKKMQTVSLSKSEAPQKGKICCL